jgi:hypothetical protein
MSQICKALAFSHTNALERHTESLETDMLTAPKQAGERLGSECGSFLPGWLPCPVLLQMPDGVLLGCPAKQGAQKAFQKQWGHGSA